jgi:Xaa-Pro aminopeptidase
MHLTLWPVTGPSYFVAPEFRASATTFLEQFRGYYRWEPEPMRVVADVLREAGLSHGRIGVEKHAFPAGFESQLVTDLPGASFVNADRLFNLARAVKTIGEIEHLTRINNSTLRAFKTTFAQAGVGSTEREIYESLSAALLQEGADHVPFAVVASGESGQLGHAAPSSRQLQRGDVLWLDAGGSWDGYLTDLARGAIVGSAGGEEQDIYSRLAEIQERIATALRPGVTGPEFYAQANAAYDAVGLPARWGILGHAIGLGLHDYPQCSPIESIALEEGMVLCIEPGFRTEDRYAVSIEDIFLVTPDGGRRLNDRWGSQELFVIS